MCQFASGANLLFRCMLTHIPHPVLYGGELSFQKLYGDEGKIRFFVEEK